MPLLHLESASFNTMITTLSTFQQVNGTPQLCLMETGPFLKLATQYSVHQYTLAKQSILVC